MWTDFGGAGARGSRIFRCNSSIFSYRLPTNCFFADNNIAYHTKYYLKPISQDEFTIHTLYPNDNNKVKFSTTDFVGSHDYKKSIFSCT